MIRPRIVIVGSGVAGLGAAHALARAGLPFQVFEAQDRPGGLVRTDIVEGFRFDRAGHFLHFHSEEFSKVVRASGVQFVEVERRSAILLDGAIVPYPIQFNLWAAEPRLRDAVIAEIESLPGNQPNETESFDEALRATWGVALFDAFFRPYNEKMWGCPLTQLPADCGGRFMPRPDIELLRRGAASPVSDYGYNSTFLYPTSGQIGDLTEALAVPFADRIKFNAEVTEINLDRRACRVNDRWIDFDYMVNTDALPRAISACGVEPLAAPMLESSGLLNIRVGFEGSINCEDHWHYVPDPKIFFYRVGYPPNVNKNACPPGCASLSIECNLSEDLQDPEAAAREALSYLESLGILTWGEIRVTDSYRISPAYVQYRRSGRELFDSVFDSLERRRILMAGRYGLWDYMSIEDSFLSGARAADRLIALSH